MDTPTVKRQRNILSKTDLSGLTCKQQEMVRNVIREELEGFSERKRDNNVGEIVPTQ